MTTAAALYRYAYRTWLMRSSTRHTCGPDLEIYGPQYRPAAADSVVLHALPVQPA